MRKSLFILFAVISIGLNAQKHFDTKAVKNYNYSYTTPIYDVYVLLGQSNAVGTCTGTYISSTTKDYANLFTYNIQKLKQYKTGTIYGCCPTIESVGIEYGLGKLFADTNPVIFVKYAVNGTMLYDDGVNVSWNTSVIGTNRSLLDTLVITINSFKQYAALNNINYIFKGIIYFQGEADSNLHKRAEAYGENEYLLIKYLRTYTGIYNLPFYDILINDFKVDAHLVNSMKIANDTIINKISINTSAITFKSDSVHVDELGLKNLCDTLINVIRRVNY